MEGAFLQLFIFTYSPFPFIKSFSQFQERKIQGFILLKQALLLTVLECNCTLCAGYHGSVNPCNRGIPDIRYFVFIYFAGSSPEQGLDPAHVVICANLRQWEQTGRNLLLFIDAVLHQSPAHPCVSTLVRALTLPTGFLVNLLKNKFFGLACEWTFQA